MKAAAPRVSVILPLYNSMAFVDETIESVLAQTFADFELLIIDDGSSDGSLEQALAWAQKNPDRIRVLTHPDNANRGVSATRNLGMEEAAADLFAFIDADDTWPPGKLAQQVELFDQYPELGLAGGAALYWGSWDGGKDWKVVAGHRPDTLIPPIEAALGTYPLGKAQAPCPSTLMVRRSLINRISGFEEQFRGPYSLYEDQALLTKCYLDAPVYMVSETWCKYRQHSSSIMAEVLGSGKYDQVRQFYLDWLETYLARKGIADRRVHAKLARVKMRYGNPVQRLMAKLIAR